MSANATPQNESQPLHFALLLFGGLCLGTGLLNLYYSFGWPGGDLNSNFGMIGYSAIDNLTTLPGSYVSAPCIAVGALCMIIANAGAWKKTGGY